jgi:hypothetical protein
LKTAVNSAINLARAPEKPIINIPPLVDAACTAGKNHDEDWKAMRLEAVMMNIKVNLMMKKIYMMRRGQMKKIRQC